MTKRRVTISADFDVVEKEGHGATYEGIMHIDTDDEMDTVLIAIEMIRDFIQRNCETIDDKSKVAEVIIGKLREIASEENARSFTS